MKKFFYSLFGMAAMLLGTVSCSSENELIPSGSNEGVAVSFKLSLEGVVPSRAADHNPNADDDLYATGKTVDNVIAAVYSNGAEIEELRLRENSINPDLTCNVTFRLIEGQTYDFVFWAENKAAGHYNTDDLTAIKVNYTYKDENGNVKSCKANDETRDAFTAVRKGLVVKAGGMTETIKLTRPFAQLNIASLDEDHRIAELTGFGCDELSSTIVVNKLYDTYNALTETPSGQAWNVRFAMTEVPGAADEVLKNVEGNNYVGYLSMNYFLADKENGQTIEVKASFDSENSDVPVNITIPNVPVQRNWRTNIIGNILTEQTVFNIVIDPNFIDDYNYPETDKQALEYAAANGGEVTLTDDVKLDQTLNVTQNMVINLNGKTISNQAENTETDVIVVKEGATLTINGDGKVEAVSGNDGYAIIAEGKLVINGGTYRSGLDEKNDGNCTVYARGKGEVYIYGGDFSTPEGDDQTFVINKKDADRGTTTIKIYGGTFKNFNPADNISENPKQSFVAEGYTVTNKGEYYTVLPKVSDDLGNVTTATTVELEENIYVGSGTTIQTHTATDEITINGNGKTIVSTAASENDFQWYDNGTKPYMSTILSSADNSKVTVNDLNFTGTMSALMVGHYVKGNAQEQANFNAELNNVNVIDTEVVSFSANISPAVCIYGTAVLNNCNVYGTTLSPLDTDPMWPVYDIAAVNYSTTTLNNCRIGTFFFWNQAALIVNENSEIEVLVIRGNMNNNNVQNYIKINAGAKVSSIDLSNIEDKNRVKITIADGGTVGKFVDNGTEYASLEAWKNAQ